MGLSRCIPLGFGLFLLCFIFVLFCWFVFVFFFFSPSCTCQPDTRASAAWGAGGVGRVPAAAPLSAAVLWMPGLPSLPLLVCPPDPTEEERGLSFLGAGILSPGPGLSLVAPHSQCEPRAGREGRRRRKRRTGTGKGHLCSRRHVCCALCREWGTFPSRAAPDPFETRQCLCSCPTLLGGD